jgi:hypothetical protein
MEMTPSGGAYDSSARNVMPTVVVLTMATPTMVVPTMVTPTMVMPTMVAPTIVTQFGGLFENYADSEVSSLFIPSKSVSCFSRRFLLCLPSFLFVNSSHTGSRLSLAPFCRNQKFVVIVISKQTDIAGVHRTNPVPPMFTPTKDRLCRTTLRQVPAKHLHLPRRTLAPPSDSPVLSLGTIDRLASLDHLSQLS